MPKYITKNNEIIIWYNDKNINKFRHIISEELLKKYGSNLTDSLEINNALLFTFDWYLDKFSQILDKESDLAFYQALYLLHEFSAKIHQENPNTSPINELDRNEFAVYRRILKYCMEYACDLKLNSLIEGSEEYLNDKLEVIEDLMYLGDTLLMISVLISSQILIDNCIELVFVDNNLFKFRLKNYYGQILDIFGNEYKNQIDKSIVDQNALEDFDDALQKTFDIEYWQVVETIKLIHQHFEAGKFALDKWYIYPKNLNHLFGINYDKAEIFFKGLTLSKENKLTLKETILKSNNLNRYLYRPLLVWNVDDEEYSFIGDKIFIESIFSLCTNAFPWSKFPSEWENEPAFLNYVKQKGLKNDKILEDEVEKLLKHNKIKYDRNIMHLKKWNNQNYNINNHECGEIDFIFLKDNEIYLCDCKHLISRYDMNNYKNDYYAFSKTKKNYNKTLFRKINFLNNNIEKLEEHFQVVLNDKNLKLRSKIKGIFIINTPTFIMYNNDFRIYTLFEFEKLIKGILVEKTFNIIQDDEENNLIKLKEISYPYFKSPE